MHPFGDEHVMDTPRGVTSISQPSPRSAVRRNLLTEFNEADSPVCPIYGEDMNTPATETGLAPTEDLEFIDNSTGWKHLAGFWLGVIFICASLLLATYQVFPRELVLWATRELIIVSVFLVTVAVLVSVWHRFWKSNERNVGGYQQRRVLRTPRNRSDFVTTPGIVNQAGDSINIPVKRTFSGDGSTTWTEFFRYFENVSNLNQWTIDRKRGVLLTTLRGQAETYVYGLTDNTLRNYKLLTDALNQRFGHTALKDSYIAEAKLRRKRANETFRDYGQAIEDLYRRAYPGNRGCIDENSLKTFLDNCSENEEFRMAVKRTRPRSVQEAVTSAMQEECIQIGEEHSGKNPKLVRKDVYAVNKNRTHLAGDKSNENSRNSQNTTTKRRCYTCGSENHLRNRCPKSKGENGGAVPQGKASPPRQ